ncbi:MAG: CoA transferase [Candidatus Rokubacteria bacterium]|nr:CoA transferase [Candidatus Rokubacteria bacterium]
MSFALDGIRVLELARFQAGPRGGMILSDLGAEVIKLEAIGGEETRRHPPMVRGQSVYFTVYNRGKKSVCIDLRSAEGKAVFAELVKKSDVVLENFRPGVMKAMGFDYERLRALHRGIILVSVSGFGQYGPYTERPAFDSLGQAMSGLMTLTGQLEGKPIGTATSVADRYTALHATIGTLAALRHRDRTGEGQLVDVCLLDSALTMVEIPTSYYLSTGQEGGEGGRPPYRTKDGYVVIAAAGRHMASALMKIVGGPDDDTPLAGSSPAAERRARIEAWCATRTSDEACAALQAAGIPSAPVRTIPEVAKDAHLWEREMLVKMDDAVAGEMYVPGVTVKMSKTPGRVGPVPTPGQHTDEVLGTVLGYDATKLAALRAAGAIA